MSAVDEVQELVEVGPAERERRERITAAGAAGDWPAYFAALGIRGQVKPKRADLALPPPEVSSRDPWPAEVAVPAGAAGLMKLAEGLGWTARVQYSRGYRWGVGTALVHIHSVVVALRHLEPARFAVAGWEAKVLPEGGKLSWKSDMAKGWALGDFPQELGVKALKEWVKDGSDG